MNPRARAGSLPFMPSYLLHHQHDAGECAAAFAAWRGFASPLRRRPAATACLAGAHAVWWRVDAPDATEALALLPPYVARRTDAIPVRDVQIP
jgi:hypothetical protein